MGGVNCPPPRFGWSDPAAREEYIKSLANYCYALFSGARYFYASNANIESSIINENENVNDSIELLVKSRSEFEDAFSRIGSVASLNQMRDASRVDFSQQLDNICVVVRKIENSILELSLISDQGDLQSRIWDRPKLTNSMVQASEAISRCISWQASFATSYALIENKV